MRSDVVRAFVEQSNAPCRVRQVFFRYRFRTSHAETPSRSAWFAFVRGQRSFLTLSHTSHSHQLPQRGLGTMCSGCACARSKSTTNCQRKGESQGDASASPSAVAKEKPFISTWAGHPPPLKKKKTQTKKTTTTNRQFFSLLYLNDTCTCLPSQPSPYCRKPSRHTPCRSDLGSTE